MKENIQELTKLIEINDKLRLRRYDNNHDFALKWYQNIDTVYMVDGIKTPYDIDKLNKMYSYLNENYELYFIEVHKDGEFFPIGDVAFSKNDMPIVIGDINYRGKGIGKQVITALIKHAKSLGFSSLRVKEIYKYNISSQKTFESVGFIKEKESDKGFSYKLNLE